MLQISFVLLIYWTLFRLIDGQISDAEWEDMLEGFDERSYLNARRWKPGDDPYTLYAFNQRESERIPSNRALRDTRHYRYTQINRQHTHTHTLFVHLFVLNQCGRSQIVCVCSTWSVQPERRQQSGELNPTSGELCVFHTHSTVWCMNPSRAHCIEIKLIKPKLQ